MHDLPAPPIMHQQKLPFLARVYMHVFAIMHACDTCAWQSPDTVCSGYCTSPAATLNLQHQGLTGSNEFKGSHTVLVARYIVKLLRNTQHVQALRLQA